MKSEDFQNVLLAKYQNGDGPTKIFRDLNGSLVFGQLNDSAKL